MIDNRACTDRCSPGDHVCENKCNDSKERGEIVHVVVKNVEYFRENTLERKVEMRGARPRRRVLSQMKRSAMIKGAVKMLMILVCVSATTGSVTWRAMQALRSYLTERNGPTMIGIGERKYVKYYSFTIPPGVESTVIVELYRTNGDQFCSSRERRTG